MTERLASDIKKDIIAASTRMSVRCVKSIVPCRFNSILDTLYSRALGIVREMLKNRQLSSSKHWKIIPCAVSKGLINKYQRNWRCKSVRRLVLPICGDKGRAVKLVDGGIRVPILLKKEVIPVVFPWPIIGFIRQVEFFKREGKWFMSVCVNTPCEKPIEVTGVVGVDRNSVGNVAVMADPQTGKVLKLGIDPAGTKRCFRGRRANLQREGKTKLLAKTRRQQSRRMTYENHRASKTVVDYAATHRRAIVLENLSGVRSKGSKIRRYVDKNQWTFAQLETFLKYKAALRGVPILYVDPAYTSQACSRCGNIHKVNGKRYNCVVCGHKEHRDVNAAFNIGRLGARVLSGAGGGSLSVLPSRPIGGPYAGKERAQCAS